MRSNLLPQAYPNPSNDTVNIQLEETFRDELFLQWVNGQFFLKKHLNTSLEKINLNQLPTGLYFLPLIRQDGKLYHEKLLKK